MSDLDPMTAAERELLLHRWAIRVNLPADAARAAEASRQLVASARGAGLPVPADVERAADTLDWCARFIADLLDHERAEQDRLGLDPAAYQRRGVCCVVPTRGVLKTGTLSDQIVTASSAKAIASRRFTGSSAANS